MKVDVPHSLGKQEAARRLREGSGKLGAQLPAGADVTTHWPADDRMAVTVNAMGQKVDADVAVLDDKIVVDVRLPPMLSFFGGAISSTVKETGAKLLGAPKK